MAQARLGQATVEAAVLLPTVLVLLGLLVQPVCLLYTRAVMAQVASECARILATGDDATVAGCRAFALRRLAAVPEAAPFHVGGEGDWDIELDVEGEGSVCVTIAGHARPLPLTALVARTLGATDGIGVRLRVEARERLRPSWVQGEYEQWISMW